MRTEFFGTWPGCRSEILGANPEDFPQAGADLLLSGRVKKALGKFRDKIRTREGRKNIALRVASGGLINTRPQATSRPANSIGRMIGSRR